jgi:uncharacterized protein (TIGR03067 family)
VNPEFNANKFSIKYHGTVKGDTITGKGNGTGRGIPANWRPNARRLELAATGGGQQAVMRWVTSGLIDTSASNKGHAMTRIALAAVLLAAGTTGADDDVNRAELKRVRGTWVAVSGEANGNKIPRKELPVQWTFKSDGKAVFSHREKGDEARYFYNIDPSKTPKTIDLTYEGPSASLKNMKQFGIYKIEKGELTLCIAGVGTKEKDRPKEFATRAAVVLLLKLERAKDQ